VGHKLVNPSACGCMVIVIRQRQAVCRRLTCLLIQITKPQPPSPLPQITNQVPQPTLVINAHWLEQCIGTIGPIMFPRSSLQLSPSVPNHRHIWPLCNVCLIVNYSCGNFAGKNDFLVSPFPIKYALQGWPGCPVCNQYLHGDSHSTNHIGVSTWAQLPRCLDDILRCGVYGTFAMPCHEI
jgi:hypothetical protein